MDQMDKNRPRETFSLRQKPLGWIMTRILRSVAYIFQRIILPFFHTLKVEHVTIESEHLQGEEIKLIHLSDFHYDWAPFPVRIYDDLLKNIVKVTEEENADLVLLTGDYVQRRSEPIVQFASQWIPQLKSKHGTWGVLGNHDYHEGMKGRDLIIQHLEKNGVNVMMNKQAHPIKDRDDFLLVGVSDFYVPADFRPDVAFGDKKPAKHPFTIFLSHNPDSAAKVRQYPIDLQLSGHTHGGQVCLPVNRPIIPLLNILTNRLSYGVRRALPFVKHFNVVKNWKWGIGMYKDKRDDGGINHVYTNRGLATHPPFRLFCNPELTIFHIKPKQLKSE